MDTDTTTMSPETLRTQMVEKIRKAGHAHRAEVEQVLLNTPRHEFVPDADLAVAYDPWQAVVTHRFADGRALSCSSAPWVVAAMLDQLDVQPGNRILEIGAGTGYNAALLAQLAGRADLVTTIDIGPDVTAQATRALAAAGYGDVHVITGDGGLGYPGHGPYDRMIATVSPWDIPAPWWQQLAPGGRLVAPLRFPVKSACCDPGSSGSVWSAASPPRHGRLEHARHRMRRDDSRRGTDERRADPAARSSRTGPANALC